MCASLLQSTGDKRKYWQYKNEHWAKIPFVCSVRCENLSMCKASNVHSKCFIVDKAAKHKMFVKMMWRAHEKYNGIFASSKYSWVRCFPPRLFVLLFFTTNEFCRLFTRNVKKSLNNLRVTSFCRNQFESCLQSYICLLLNSIASGYRLNKLIFLYVEEESIQTLNFKFICWFYWIFRLSVFPIGRFCGLCTSRWASCVFNRCALRRSCICR